MLPVRPPSGEIVSKMKAEGIEFLRFEQSDTHGISRSKTVPRKHVADYLDNGLNFLLGQLAFSPLGDVCMGTGYLESRGFPDSLLFADYSTYKVVPYADATARVLCTPSILKEGPAAAAPRHVLQAQLARAEGLGFKVVAGFEPEFYIVDAKTKTPSYEGINIFSTLRNNFDEAVVYQILRDMDKL